MSLSKIEIMMEVMQERLREMQREMKTMEKKYEERIETLRIQHTKEIKQLEEKITQEPPSSIYDNCVVELYFYASRWFFLKIGIEELNIPQGVITTINADAFSSLYKLRKLTIDLDGSYLCYEALAEKFQKMKNSSITHFILKNAPQLNFEILPPFINLETLTIHTLAPVVLYLTARLPLYTKLKYLHIHAECWNGRETLKLQIESKYELERYCQEKGITLKIE